jgi:hypothetical protein
MPHRRRVQKGSFGGHFDEMVKHFYHRTSPTMLKQSNEADGSLRDKLDVHARLFERAWQLDRENLDKRGR